MIVVSWNCAGALRKKFQAIDRLAPDICIVQECEDPAQSKSDAYREWAGTYLWTGGNKNRGLGIFVRPGIKLEPVPLDSGALESFLPCRVQDSLLLLGVWTKSSTSHDYRYIGQMWKYLQLHRGALGTFPTIVVGDLNSNSVWDSQHSMASHSMVVKELSDIGMESAYHKVTGASQGKEPTPTFFMHRKLEKPYHIDYAFLPSAWASNCQVEIGSPGDWLALSDHMPLKVGINAAGTISPAASHPRN